MESSSIREIRPVVIPAQYFLFAPFASAFISIFPGFFTFIISNIINAWMGNSFSNASHGPILVYGLSAFTLSFIVCMFLISIKVFREPAQTTYTIYHDRIEYFEGLLNRHRRTVIFDQVIDVELTEGLLQQTKAAGTITLITQQLVTQGQAQLSNRRIALKNVPQPKEIYDLIRSLAIKTNAA